MLKQCCLSLPFAIPQDFPRNSRCRIAAHQPSYSAKNAETVTNFFSETHLPYRQSWCGIPVRTRTGRYACPVFRSPQFPIPADKTRMRCALIFPDTVPLPKRKPALKHSADAYALYAAKRPSIFSSSPCAKGFSVENVRRSTFLHSKMLFHGHFCIPKC